MSLSNPFEKLNIKRDIEEEDDDQGEFQKVKGKEKNLPVGIEKKREKLVQKKMLKQMMKKDLKKLEIKQKKKDQ